MFGLPASRLRLRSIIPAVAKLLRGCFHLLLCAGLPVPFVGVAHAQEVVELNGLATRVARIVAKHSKRVQGEKRTIVTDFVEVHGTISQLGPYLADELSVALAKQAVGFLVIGRDRLKALMAEEKLDPGALRDPEAVACLAESAGASTVVGGTIEVLEDGIEISAAVWKVPDRKKLLDERLNVAKAPKMQELLAEFLPRAQEQQGAAGQAAVAGKNGVSFPRCQYCPNPSYTEEAVWNKIQGRVLLRIIVGPDGLPTSITIIRGLTCGLNERVLQTVSGWRFKPAVGPDGKPVAVSVAAEVSFRLLRR